MADKFPGSKLKSYSPKAIVTAPPEQRKHILRRFWLPAVLILALVAGTTAANLGSRLLALSDKNDRQLIAWNARAGSSEA